MSTLDPQHLKTPCSFDISAATTATGLFGFLGMGAAPPKGGSSASSSKSLSAATPSGSSETTSMWQKIADKMLQVQYRAVHPRMHQPRYILTFTSHRLELGTPLLPSNPPPRHFTGGEDAPEPGGCGGPTIIYCQEAQEAGGE